MTKLIAGFLLGVITALAVVYWLGRETPDNQERTSSDPSVAEINSGAEKASISSATEETPKAEAEKFASSTSSDTYSNSGDSGLQEQNVSATQSPTPATPPVISGTTATSSVEYPPEIADMLEGHVDKDLQARYESDEREESWATYMEGQLAAYFSQKPELSQFSFSLIDCRTSICEVHALGYGVDAMTQWSRGTADIVGQTWHDFQSMSVNHHNPQPDILGIVLILTRQPPQS